MSRNRRALAESSVVTAGIGSSADLESIMCDALKIEQRLGSGAR
jgi:hypothetical protein